MLGDGNGWVTTPDGTKLWGRFGAAGLFLVAVAVGVGLTQSWETALLAATAVYGLRLAHRGGTQRPAGNRRPARAARARQRVY